MGCCYFDNKRQNTVYCTRVSDTRLPVEYNYFWILSHRYSMGECFFFFQSVWIVFFFSECPVPVTLQGAQHSSSPVIREFGGHRLRPAVFTFLNTYGKTSFNWLIKFIFIALLLISCAWDGCRYEASLIDDTRHRGQLVRVSAKFQALKNTERQGLDGKTAIVVLGKKCGTKPYPNRAFQTPIARFSAIARINWIIYTNYTILKGWWEPPPHTKKFL